MHWKSYVVVSGAGLLATYLASMEPSRMPERVPLAQPRDGATAGPPAADIEQLALHLQARLQQESLYREPARNPFRFVQRKADTRPVAAPDVVDARPVAMPDPPPPPMRLVGVAVDREAGADAYTAILTTPSGVVLARVGDEVLGQFRVTKVDDGAVEFVTISDGTTGRLTLRP
jgi:hypothetical protein